MLKRICQDKDFYLKYNSNLSESKGKIFELRKLIKIICRKSERLTILI